MITLKSKEECCGCTACKSICPQKAIKMIEDKEGFLYPVIDKERCVQCGLCDKVCPILKKLEKREEISSLGYIVNHKENEIRKQSTSGGAFTAIAKYVIEKDGIVYGANFDEEFNVVHSGVRTVEELEKFRGSKYVQSNLQNTFEEIKGQLENKEMVCFSGTPCQVEGLKKFLRKDYENLVTVDIVCHAVPSPKLFRKYLKYIKEKELDNEKIINVSFRNKDKYGYQYSLMKVEGKTKKYYRGVESDPYYRAFFNNISDRPSCYSCKFRDKNRVSDFTIWDCFIAEEFDKAMDDNLGTTRMLIHTNKGKEIFEEIKEDFIYQPIETNKLTADVKEIRESIKINPIREEFFKELDQLEPSILFEKYFPDTFKVKLERTTRRILVKFPIYKAVKKTIKKIVKR